MNESKNKTGNESAPIFVVGAPRSGTSLLRNLLNRHTAIALADETYFFYYVYDRRGDFGDLSEQANRKLLVDRYLETTRIKQQGYEIERLSNILLEEGSSYERFFETLMKEFATQRGKMRFGEKTPDHAMACETLIEMFPSCRIIHLIRDPRDVVASLLRMPWGNRTVLANARRWFDCTKGAIRCRGHENYFEIKYETLTQDPEDSLKKICDFIGEKYEATMLEPDSKSEASKWWFQRAKSAVTTGRIEKWRDELSPKQVSLIESFLGPIMKETGYDSNFAPPGRMSLVFAKIEMFFDQNIKKIRTLPAIWSHWFSPTNLAYEESWIDRKPNAEDHP